MRASAWAAQSQRASKVQAGHDERWESSRPAGTRLGEHSFPAADGRGAEKIGGPGMSEIGMKKHDDER